MAIGLRLRCEGDAGCIDGRLTIYVWSQRLTDDLHGLAGWLQGLAGDLQSLAEGLQDLTEGLQGLAGWLQGLAGDLQSLAEGLQGLAGWVAWASGRLTGSSGGVTGASGMVIWASGRLTESSGRVTRASGRRTGLTEAVHGLSAARGCLRNADVDLVMVRGTVTAFEVCASKKPPVRFHGRHWGWGEDMNR